MKIAAAEALWDTEQPAVFSLFQIGGFTQSDETPTFDHPVPHLLSFLATGSFNGKVEGLNQLQQQYQQQYGTGRLHPARRSSTGRMRAMAYSASLVFLVALVGGWLLPAPDARAVALVPADRRSRRSRCRSSPPPPAGC